MLPSVAAPSAAPLPMDLLLVDADPSATRSASMLRATYRVMTTATATAALEHMSRTSPDLIVTELCLPDGSGVDICRRAQALATPAIVLITTTAVEGIPDALLAGCDGVLLKPFALNLLYARIGHLLRTRSLAPLRRAQRQPARPDDPDSRSLRTTGTNWMWPTTQCPYCNREGVASFEFASHRRAWYACLGCRRVWLAKQLE